MTSLTADALHHPSSLTNDVLVIFIPAPLNETWIARIKALHPGLEIRWVSREEEEETLSPDVLEGATLLCSYRPQEAALLKTVRFVQLTSAGANRWTKHEKYADPNVIFCTANGVHPPQIAEWVVGTYLLMQRHFLAYAGHQKDGFWAKSAELNRRYAVEDSPGKRIGILGYGAIGRQVARLFSAMGMEVYAYTRSARPTPASRRDDSYVVPGTGDAAGLIPARWFHGGSRAAVNDFLAQDLDVLVVSLPLTEATRHLLGREQFAILAGRQRGRGTFVSNIARGEIISTDALLEALHDGQISGAALDVTHPEPLPAEHPLWRAPNCFITPHMSWSTPSYWDRLLDILEINLDKLDKGERPINLMDRTFHY